MPFTLLLDQSQSQGQRSQSKGMQDCPRDLFTCPFISSGIGIWNPAFDVTPADLITGGIVTEFGVFTPSELKAKLQEALRKE